MRLEKGYIKKLEKWDVEIKNLKEQIYLEECKNTKLLNEIAKEKEFKLKNDTRMKRSFEFARANFEKILFIHFYPHK